MDDSTNPGQETTRQGPTDIGALSAGVVAVAVSMFVTSGPYDFLGSAIAFSVVLVVFGYIAPHTRTRSQSLAFAAVVALLFLQMTGFVVELTKAKSWMSLLECYNTVSCAGRDREETVCSPHPEKADTTLCVRNSEGSTSSVDARLQMFFWVLMFMILYHDDLERQKKKAAQLAEEQKKKPINAAVTPDS